MLVINLKAKLHWIKLYAPTYNVYTRSILKNISLNRIQTMNLTETFQTRLNHSNIFFVLLKLK